MSSTGTMGSSDWLDHRLAQRQWAARQRVAARGLEQVRKRRLWLRDMARAALAVSLILLAVLVVEIGRKAITVKSHAAAALPVAEWSLPG
ncbi:MAG TPA: hypothetical protein VED21_34865 [Azospirillum sp.]|nr:hypothetical protein [Azospirillum sp.]